MLFCMAIGVSVRGSQSTLCCVVPYVGVRDSSPRVVVWPCELLLGIFNPRFVAWPLELGLRTNNSRVVVWPLELG